MAAKKANTSAPTTSGSDRAGNSASKSYSGKTMGEITKEKREARRAKQAEQKKTAKTNVASVAWGDRAGSMPSSNGSTYSGKKDSSNTGSKSEKTSTTKAESKSKAETKVKTTSSTSAAAKSEKEKYLEERHRQKLIDYNKRHSENQVNIHTGERETKAEKAARLRTSKK